MQAVIFRYVTPRIRAKVGMWLVKKIQDTSEHADYRLMPNIRGALECLSFSCDLNMPKARSDIPDQFRSASLPRSEEWSFFEGIQGSLRCDEVYLLQSEVRDG